MQVRNSTITATDLFCGAGGSTTGAKHAGVQVRLAANHWARAIETHNMNHPDVDHALADLHQDHPRRFPTTDILIASPECTNHALAKGKKRKGIYNPNLWGQQQLDPAEERSRCPRNHPMIVMA